MDTENLDGTLVLVKPDANKGEDRYRIGVLTYAWWRKNHYIRFLDGGSSNYKPDHVMKLKDGAKLYEHLICYGWGMKREDFWPTYKIYFLMDRGCKQELIWAMEFARDNPHIHHRVLDTINLEQPIGYKSGIGR